MSVPPTCQPYPRPTDAPERAAPPESATLSVAGLLAVIVATT